MIVVQPRRPTRPIRLWALTAFMGIPLAGTIFALEMTRPSAGLTSRAREAFSPAVASSLAAIALLRALLIPDHAVGGHFYYGDVGVLGGRTMIGAALVAGAGGALIGTVFHKIVAFLKSRLWTPTSSSGGTKVEGWRGVLVKTCIGFVVGLLSTRYPQTLFWGEGSLQCMIDGQATAFSATKHGLATYFTGSAVVNPSLPFSNAGAALQIGIAKLFAIILACAGKFPGGIIFPLFFAAAPLAHSLALAGAGLFPSLAIFQPSVIPVLVMCLMASTQASVTRTPLATALMLSLLASTTTDLSSLLPACLVASYAGVYISQLLSKKSYFKYSEQ